MNILRYVRTNQLSVQGKTENVNRWVALPIAGVYTECYSIKWIVDSTNK